MFPPEPEPDSSDDERTHSAAAFIAWAVALFISLVAALCVASILLWLRMPS